MEALKEKEGEVQEQKEVKTAHFRLTSEVVEVKDEKGKTLYFNNKFIWDKKILDPFTKMPVKGSIIKFTYSTPVKFDQETRLVLEEGFLWSWSQIREQFKVIKRKSFIETPNGREFHEVEGETLRGKWITSRWLYSHEEEEGEDEFYDEE